MCLLSLSALPMPLLAQPQAQTMMEVEAMQGAVRVARTDGSDNLARSGSALAAGDAVSTSAQAHVDLQLYRYGQFDLGENSALQLLRLPFSGYDSDLSTDLRLQHGYVRIVWKRPGSLLWPLTIAYGERRVSLSPGEYFFDSSAAEQLCIAGGEAMVSGASGQQQMLHGPACYRLHGELTPQRSERSVEDFIAMRGARRILAQTSAAPAVAVAGQPASAPAESVVEAPAAQATAALASSPAAPSETRIDEAPAAPAQATLETAPRAQSGWTLNVTSVTTLATAQQDVARLIAAGYKPSIQTAQLNGKQWYRVQVGGFASALEAKSAGTQIEQKLGYTGTWTIKP